MDKIKYRHELKHYINLGECAILRKTSFVNEISRENGVNSAVMVRYNGDYMS